MAGRRRRDQGEATALLELRAVTWGLGKQKEFAAAAGVSAATISNTLQGKQRIPHSVMAALGWKRTNAFDLPTALEKIKKMREQFESATAFGKRYGIQPATLSMVMRGRIKPGASMLDKLGLGSAWVLDPPDRLLRTMPTMPPLKDIIEALTRACEVEGSQAEFASRHKISQQYLNDMLHGREPPNEKVCRLVGLLPPIAHAPVRKAPPRPVSDEQLSKRIEWLSKQLEIARKLQSARAILKALEEEAAKGMEPLRE